MPTTQTEPDETGPEKTRTSRKRGCLFIGLLLILVGLPIILLILNGPGFRTLARMGAVKAAESRGLNGSLDISGSLWSGFSLSSIDFSGSEENPALFQIEEASIRYSAPKLIRSASSFNWLDTLAIRKARLIIPLPGPTQGSPEKDSSDTRVESKSTATDFSPLWNLLESNIEIEDLSLELLSGEESITIANLSVKSSPDENGYLRVKRITIPGQDEITDVDAKIIKGEKRIEIGAIRPLPFLTLNSLSVAEPSPGKFEGGALLDIAGGAVLATMNESSQVRLHLNPETAIDLTRIQLDPETPLKLTGAVTQFDLRFDGDFADPRTWKLGGEIHASGAGWENISLDALQLAITGNRLQLDASRPGATFNALVSAPFQQAATPEDLQKIPIDVAAKLNVSSLASALEGIAGDLPFTGAVTLEARDFQIRNGKDLQSGNLLLLSENLAWDSILLSGVQFAANVESPNQLQIAGDLGLDLANRFQLLAGLDLDAMSYNGEAKAEFNTAGRLGDVLTDLGTSDIGGRAFLNWKGNGQLEESLHRGEATIGLEKLVIKTGSPVNGELVASYEGTSVSLTSLDLNAGQSRLSGRASWDGKRILIDNWALTRPESTPLILAASLPFDPNFEGPFPDQPGELSLDLKAHNLSASDVTLFFSDTPPLNGRLNGNLTGRGTFKAIALNGDFDFTPEGEGLPEDSLVTLDLGLKGDVNNPETWDADLLAHISGLQFQEIDLETISLKANTTETSGVKSLLAEVDFNQSTATLDAQAALLLDGATDFEALAKRPLEMEGALVVEKLETLLNEVFPDLSESLPLSGSLNAGLKGFLLEDGSFSKGEAVIESPALAYRGESVEQLSIDASVSEPDQFDLTAQIDLDDSTFVSATGGYHLKDQTYRGDLEVKADLSASGKLRKVLSGTPALALLPRITDLTWTGTGAIKDKRHEGALQLNAEQVTLAEGAEPLNLKLEGKYSETSADFPVIEVNSQPLALTGSLRWLDNVLYLDQWKGNHRSREVLSINGSLPLDPETLTAEKWFSGEGPVDFSLKTNALAVDSLSTLFLAQAPLSGDLSLDLDLAGTPSALAISSDLLLDKITVPQEEKDLPVGRLKLDLNTGDGNASVNGIFQHPDINPFVITAALPFRPAAWATGERKMLDESIKASAKMDRSSLAFLRSQVPGIETIEGTVAIDAAIDGSLAKPAIKGNGFIDLDRLKMEDRNAPSLRDMDLVARFEKDTVVLESLRAIVAGGIVEGNGRAKLVAGEDPELDFRINGSEVLVFRNPDVSVRTDADISITGPFSAVTIAGELGITNSRYFKNFDLLPVGLPVRNKSVLPTVEKSPRGGGAAYQDLNVGVPNEPFKNWPVNLRIYTKDPFLVRSNLVESALNADLSLSGTLGTPVPNGYVRIDEGELSLPFSSVDVEKGEILFDESTGFNGALEFKAQAKADKYRANIYLFNRVLSPKYVLTSNPPLPSEDIMTLLATGSVRSDLVGDDAGSVAASKAAKLFLKNIRKSSAKADRERTLLDDLQDRTELELGGVNPETGDQTFGGKIRLWKQLFFVGDVDAESDYRALLKYVFRFR